ncbi:MAG: hypothetical protein RIC55_06130 [Pirellulaceae bacterium]
MDPRRRFSLLLGVIALVAVGILFFWGGRDRRAPSPAPAGQVKNVSLESNSAADKLYRDVRLSRPLADFVEAVPGDVEVLAVRDGEGHVYVTDVQDGQARLCLLEGEDVRPVWTTPAKGRRMDLAGTRGDELIVVFHDGLSYTNPLQAWRDHDEFYGIQPSAWENGLTVHADLADVAKMVVADHAQGN